METVDIIKKNKVWIIIAIIITIIHCLYASSVLRGAYLDGAMFEMILLNKFSTGHYGVYSDLGHTRFFINFLEQLPMAIGYFVFFIKSKYWLSFLFSLPLFLFPPLILWWNYNLSKRTLRYDIFVISVLSYSAILLPYTIFSIVETTVGVLLLFVLFNYLAGDINYTKNDLFLIFLLVVAMFGIQEFVLFVGFVFFIASLYYGAKEKNIFNRIVKYAIGLGSLMASSYVGLFILSHSHTQQESVRFLKEMFDFYPQILNLNSILTITALLLIVVILFMRNYLKPIFQVLIGIIFAAVLAHMFFNLQTYLCPMWEGHLRTIPCWGTPILFTCILFFDLIKKNPSNVFYTNLLTIALACGIAHTVWQINHDFWFNKNIEYMQQELKNCSEPLYIQKPDKEISSFFNEDLRRYIWNFSYAASSILFSPQKEVKVLMLQPKPRPEEIGGNNSYPEWLYTEGSHLIIPTATMNIKNEFWDTTDVSKALSEYNKKYYNYPKPQDTSY